MLEPSIISCVHAMKPRSCCCLIFVWLLTASWSVTGLPSVILKLSVHAQLFGASIILKRCAKRAKVVSLCAVLFTASRTTVI